MEAELSIFVNIASFYNIKLNSLDIYNAWNNNLNLPIELLRTQHELTSLSIPKLTADLFHVLRDMPHLSSLKTGIDKSIMSNIHELSTLRNVKLNLILSTKGPLREGFRNNEDFKLNGDDIIQLTSTRLDNIEEVTFDGFFDRQDCQDSSGLIFRNLRINWTNLKHLTASKLKSSNVMNFFINPFLNIRSLECLTLGIVRGVAKDNLEPLYFANHSQRYPNIKNLSITSRIFYLQDLINALPNLEGLHISTDSDINYVYYSPRIIRSLQALSKLQNLTIEISVKSSNRPLTFLDANLVKDLCNCLEQFRISFDIAERENEEEFIDEMRLCDSFMEVKTFGRQFKFILTNVN
jgi:hypothetical protein